MRFAIAMLVLLICRSALGQAEESRFLRSAPGPPPGAATAIIAAPPTEFSKAEPTPEIWGHLLSESDRMKAGKLKMLTGTISEARIVLQKIKSAPVAAKPKPGIQSFATKPEKDDAQAAAQKTVKDLESHLTHVRDGTELIVMAMEPPKIGSMGRPGPLRVVQVLDSKSFYGVSYFGSDNATPFIIRGVDTSGLTDEAHCDLTTCYIASGKEEHRLRGGGKQTVLTLEPFDVNAFLKKNPRGSVKTAKPATQ